MVTPFLLPTDPGPQPEGKSLGTPFIEGVDLAAELARGPVAGGPGPWSPGCLRMINNGPLKDWNSLLL